MKPSLFAAVAVFAFATAGSAQIKTTGTLRPSAASGGVKAEVAAPVAATAPATRMMPPSTLVQLTPAQEISSKHIEEGQTVAFVTVSDVVEGESVVIPRGSPVNATVTWKTGRAIGGKSGKFEVRFDSVRVRGKSYPMSGTFRQEGRGNSVGALLGSMIVTGRSAVMLPGQIVNGFTAAQIAY